MERDMQSSAITRQPAISRASGKVSHFAKRKTSQTTQESTRNISQLTNIQHDKTEFTCVPVGALLSSHMTGHPCLIAYEEFS